MPGRVVIPGSAGVPPAQDLAGSWRLASQGWSVHLPTGAGAAPLQECGRDARAPGGNPWLAKCRSEFCKRLPEETFFADLVCFERIIVEIKALARLSGTEQAQLLNYLKGTGFHPPPHQPSPAGSAEPAVEPVGGKHPAPRVNISSTASASEPLVDQRKASGRMVKPAVLPLILLVAAM